MNDNPTMTNNGHSDGLDIVKSHLSGTVIPHGNLLSDGISDAELISGSASPFDAEINDDWQMDFPEGNGDDLLAYPDPLAHAGEYLPDQFYLNDVQDNINIPTGDNDNLGSSAVSYIMSADGGVMPSWNDVNELPGVENGMLSDPSQLDGLIAAGEIQGTTHINTDDEVRSEEAVKNFLHEHGYTDVPAGYEVHHIVPLSQGGADDPHNMVLLTEAQHDAVTAAHRQYYGW